MKRVLRRITILSKLAMSILHARISGQRRPVFIGLYITNRCNLRCAYCFVNMEDRFDDPARAGFSGDQVIEMVDQLYERGTRWIFLLGGEPVMHPEIRRIVRHIVDKGILLHILTNGTLIEQKIDDIEAADGVCVSIDGGEESTDAMRGKGTFSRALRGVEVALSRGMKVRLHAVLNRYSMGEMESLAEMARKMGVTITISPPNFLGHTDDPALAVSREEYKDFYRRYRILKERGFPVANSYFSIDKAINWPVGYHEFIRKGEYCEGYEPIPCVIGELHGCIDAEGTMFNCIQLGCLDGLNVHEVGIDRAWDELPKRRPDCVSCASVNTIETAAYLNLLPAIYRDGLRFFLGRYGTGKGR